MSGREDTRLVDHLYDELSEKEAREYRRALEQDPALASEAEALESLESTLGLMRQHEDEDPPPHLDSLILAHAREEATKLAESGKGVRGFLKKMFRSPAIGLAVAGSVVAVVAVVTVPVAMNRAMQESAPSAPIELSYPAGESVRSPEPAQSAPIVRAQAEDRAEPNEPAPPPDVEAESAEPREGVVERKLTAKKRRTRADEQRAASGAAYTQDGRDGDEAQGGKPARPPVVLKPAETPVDAPPVEEKPAAATTPPRESLRSLREASGNEDSEAELDDLRGAAKSARGPGLADSTTQPIADEATVAKQATKPRMIEPQSRAKEEPATETKKSKADQPSRSPAKKSPPRDSAPAAGMIEPTTTTMDPARAALYASDVIRAAEAQLGLKDSVGARRILVNALSQTKGTPAYGEVALRLAQLDYAERRLADAARNARIAANVPSFAKRRIALDLLDRAQREAAPAQAAPSGASRAKQAAPEQADEAASEDAR